jgi:hypothetical protein
LIEAIKREKPGAFPQTAPQADSGTRLQSAGILDGRRYRVVQGEINASELAGQVGRKGKTEGDAVKQG